jgi:Na+-driven multidrug efflux pump
MRATFTNSLLVTTAFTLLAWAILAVLARPLAEVFLATGEAERLIVLYCRWLTPLFVFLGAMFVANAVFNTLGLAHVPTVLNWGRATLGTIPFVMLGGAYAGADGVLVANMVGGVIFGTIAVLYCYRVLERIAAAAS